MQKITSIAIVVLFSITVILGLQLRNTNEKLTTANETIVEIRKDFNDYKADIDKQLTNLYASNEQSKKIQTEYIKSQGKLERDIKRENTIKAKPGLVGKLVTESFNKFAKDMQEQTQ